MKGIQSVWFSRKAIEIDYNCGWLSPIFHLMSWSLSCLQMSKFINNSILITDEVGYEVAEKLQLPYTSKSITLEIVKQKNYLWVANKLYTYSIQTEPFIHLDTDAYLFNHIAKQLLNAPLVAQNFEYDHDNYIQAYQDVLTYCKYIPACIQKDSIGRITAVNAGIIGGNNVEFFKEFTAFVTDFLQQNEVGLIKCQYAHLNVFVEQFLFKKYAEFKNIPIEYVSPIEFGPPCDYKMSEFTQLPTHCNYIHITNYKRNPTVCEQMAQRLWLESPELYERVQTVCRELEATHHRVSQSVVPEQIQELFYRTEYILGLAQSHILTHKTAEELAVFIDSLPESQTKNVLYDVFQYEKRRQEFIKKLPQPALLRQHWQRYSQQTNALLALPVAQYRHKQIQQSRYCYRIESEWNWAEVNEFTGQDPNRDLAINLQAKPSYYEVVLYCYLHQGLVREHLLDALNILILDAVEDPASIASVIQAVCDQILVYQSEINQQELADTVMSRIRHFLYHGVLEVVA